MQSWTLHFRWVKAHIGIEGNQAADRLAKEAAQEDGNFNMVFDRIAITSIINETNRKGLEQWQLQWTDTTKGAVCRSCFPKLEQRLKMKMPVTAEFTTLVTGHGKTKAYLHRFKLADDPICPCKGETQTSHHIIFEYTNLDAQRSSMIKQISISGGPWPQQRVN